MSYLVSATLFAAASALMTTRAMVDGPRARDVPLLLLSSFAYGALWPVTVPLTAVGFVYTRCVPP